MLKNTLNKIKLRFPQLHCITNYVTLNNCENTIIAVNTSPVVVKEITIIFNSVATIGGINYYNINASKTFNIAIISLILKANDIKALTEQLAEKWVYD